MLVTVLIHSGDAISQHSPQSLSVTIFLPLLLKCSLRHLPAHFFMIFLLLEHSGIEELNRATAGKESTKGNMEGENYWLL